MIHRLFHCYLARLSFLVIAGLTALTIVQIRRSFRGLRHGLQTPY